MARKKLGAERKRRRWVRWAVAGGVLAVWLTVSQLVVRRQIQGVLSETFLGEARVSFALLWPDLDATAFGVRVKGETFELHASRMRVDLKLLGLFGDDPVEGVEITGLRATVHEGQPVAFFREPHEARESAGAHEADLDPLQLPPMQLRSPTVVIAGERDVTVFSAGDVSLVQVGDRTFQIEASAGELGAIPFDKMTTRLIPRAGHVLLNDLKVHAFNGVLGGIIDVDTGRAGAINGDLELHFVEVERVWRTFDLDYAEKRRGDLSGRIVFEGDGTSFDSLKGTGELQLKRARFFSPLSFKVLMMMKVPAAEESMLTRGAMKFSFERSLVYVEKGRFDARGFDLAVQGIVGLNGRADLEIVHAGTTVSVSGDLAEPRIKVLPFNGVTAPFDRMFRERVKGP